MSATNGTDPLTAQEAAAALGLSRHAFDQIADELDWIEQGDRKVVTVAELRRWLERRGARPRGEDDHEAVETARAWLESEAPEQFDKDGKPRPGTPAAEVLAEMERTSLQSRQPAAFDRQKRLTLTFPNRRDNS